MWFVRSCICSGKPATYFCSYLLRFIWYYSAPSGLFHNQLYPVPKTGKWGTGHRRQAVPGVMNEARNKSSRAFHSHVIVKWHASVGLCAPFLLTGTQSWISFIHSSAIVPVSFDSPHPRLSPPGALNGSWRRCGTLCCFQEALLNTVCPVALSPFSSILFPHLSIEMYCTLRSHHKVQYYVSSLACRRDNAQTLRLRCFIKGSICKPLDDIDLNYILVYF